jgi:radical SAM superfamily enzyme
MDIQVNSDERVLHYLSKYLTKADTHVSVEYGLQTAANHFSARKIGIIDAVYDLLGFHKHQSSVSVIYIDTTLPGLERRRQLKHAGALSKLPANSQNIFTRSHVQKYQDRHRRLAHLTMPEYFRYYKIIKYTQEDDENGIEEDDTYIIPPDQPS